MAKGTRRKAALMEMLKEGPITEMEIVEHGPVVERRQLTRGDAAGVYGSGEGAGRV